MQSPPHAENTPDRTLAYAQPRVAGRYEAKHVVAIAFAVIAIGLGTLFTLAGVYWGLGSVFETTTREARLDREKSVRCILCGVVLIVPGVRYGRIGMRGNLPPPAESTAARMIRQQLAAKRPIT